MLLTTVLLPVLLCLGVLQRVAAEPRPDFGIKATITGTANVVKVSDRVSATFDLVDNLNLPLTSGYKLLNDMKTAITYIGGKIASEGMVLITSFKTLTADRSNDVTNAFAPVYLKTKNYRTMMTEFSSQFSTLEKQGPYITKQLTDAFNSIRDRLTLFDGALDRMKAAVTSARDAPGNPANGISSANLARYVTLTLTLDLQDALTRLNADIQLVQFVVEETQRRLGTADKYIFAMRTEGQLIVGDAKSSKDVLLSDVNTIKENVVTAVNDRLAPVYDEQVQALAKVTTELQAITTYTDDLLPALNALAMLLDADGVPEFTTAIEGKFTLYKNDVDASVASASSVEQFMVAETCVGLRTVIDVIVGSSLHSKFCYSKFAPQVMNQFAMTYYIVSECYDFEVFRLYQLQDLMSLVVNMIIFDVEDLGAAITTCAPLKDGAPCLTMIGPYYETLANTVGQKQQFITSFIEEETKFSMQRLGACVTAAKYTTVISVAATVSNTNNCVFTGPVIA